MAEIINLQLAIINLRLLLKPDDTLTIRMFKDGIKKKLNVVYFRNGYETSLPMLAWALGPKFKHL